MINHGPSEHDKQLLLNYVIAAAPLPSHREGVEAFYFKTEQAPKALRWKLCQMADNEYKHRTGRPLIKRNPLDDAGTSLYCYLPGGHAEIDKLLVEACTMLGMYWAARTDIVEPESPLEWPQMGQQPSRIHRKRIYKYEFGPAKFINTYRHKDDEDR